MVDSRASDRSLTEWAPRIVFAFALLASAALLFHYRLKIGFVADDLVFLRDRGIGGIDSMLAPHGENIVVLQAMLYRATYVVFGIGSAVPLQTISLISFLLSVIVFFVWVRARVGDWAALAAAVPILFLGVSFDDLLWAFQIGYSGSITAGLIALIALGRDGRFSLPVACVALIVSMTTSSLGLPFLFAAAVLLLHRDGRRFWHSYVLLVPALLFLAWFIGWGSAANSLVTLDNLLDAPRYIAVSVKSVVMGLTGLHRISSPAGDLLGWLATAGLTGVIAARLIRRRQLPLPFLVALAAGLAFWGLAAASQIEGIGIRSADQSRYMFPGAIFLLMITAGAFEGSRPNRVTITTLLALAAISVACSLDTLEKGSKVLGLGALVPKASMTALDIAGPAADPEFEVSIAPFFVLDYMSQDVFRELEGRYGRAGWTEDQIAGLSQPELRLLDIELVKAVGLQMNTGPGRTGGSCRWLRSRQVPGREVARIGSGTVSLTPAGNRRLKVRVGRFASTDSVAVGSVRAGETGRLAFARDLSDRAWRVSAIGEGPVRVCVNR